MLNSIHAYSCKYHEFGVDVLFLKETVILLKGIYEELLVFPCFINLFDICVLEDIFTPAFVFSMF